MAKTDSKGCGNQQDSEIAKHNKDYYFCCYEKTKMVDNEDCKKCPYYQYK
jgi:hypothetical protein